MKIKIIVGVFLVLFTSKIGAQDTIQVLPGSTHAFTAQNPMNAVSFNWNIDGIAYVSAVLGSAQTTGNIVFGATEGATSNLSVVPVSTNSCTGNTVQVTLQVTSAPSFSATLTGVASNVCPITTTNPGGGMLSATVTVIGNTTGVGAGKPIYIYYTVNGIAASLPLQMTSASESVLFNLNSPAPGAYAVQITQIKFGGKGALTSSPTANTTVDAVPTVEDIF